MSGVLTITTITSLTRKSGMATMAAKAKVEMTGELNQSSLSPCSGTTDKLPKPMVTSTTPRQSKLRIR